jgi:hypothetical protein
VFPFSGISEMKKLADSQFTPYFNVLLHFRFFEPISDQVLHVPMLDLAVRGIFDDRRGHETTMTHWEAWRSRNLQNFNRI